MIDRASREWIELFEMLCVLNNSSEKNSRKWIVAEFCYVRSQIGRVQEKIDRMCVFCLGLSIEFLNIGQKKSLSWKMRLTRYLASGKQKFVGFCIRSAWFWSCCFRLTADSICNIISLITPSYWLQWIIDLAKKYNAEK